MAENEKVSTLSRKTKKMKKKRFVRPRRDSNQGLNCPLNSPNTFHNFSTTHILCEINFGESRSTKHADLTYLEALNLDF